MTCKSGRVEFQSVSPGRRWSREDRIEGKGRFSVVCEIERKTMRGESSWFEKVILKNEHADVWAGNSREQELGGRRICQ